MSQIDPSFIKHTGAGIIRRTVTGRFIGEFNRDYKRRRKTFGTEEAAADWLAGFATARDREGRAVLELKAAEMADAKAALSFLRDNGHRETLLTVAEAFIEAHRPPERPTYTGAAGESVATWAGRYFEHLQHPTDGGDPCRPRTLKGKRSRLQPFLAAFGTRPAGNIGRADVDGVLRTTGATGRNLLNFQIEAQSLFNFAAKASEGSFTNTAARFPQRKKRETPPAEIMRPDEVKRFLHELERMGIDSPDSRAADVALVMALSCFAGLRTAELADAYGPGLEWQNIDFDERQIIVPAAVSKTRRRREVPIADNLLAWLVKYRTGPDCKPRTGGIAPGHATCTRRRKEAETATGIAWVANGGRHSFATYFGKLHGYRAAAEALGHLGGMAIFEAHYKGDTVRRKTAEEYFQIAPAKAKRGKVIRMKGAA